MKFQTNVLKQPLLRLNNGKVINLNTLQEAAPIACTPVKVCNELKISKHENQQFLDKAKRFFSVSKVSKEYGISWYKLESNLIVYCIIYGDSLQLVGNYPLHYLKLLYRYINKAL